MNESGIDCYHLPVAALSALTTQAVGKLTPVLTPQNDIVPYTARDSFNQALRRSGRMLLQTGAGAKLLRADGYITEQPGANEIQFIADFPKGPVKHALADFSPLRRLLAIGSGEMQQAVLALMDDEGKTHCRACLTFLTTAKGRSAALAALQGIKGYDASLDALREHIQKLGGIAFSSGALYGQLFPTRSAYAPKPDILIASDTTAFDAANTFISTHIPLARANVPGVIADHDTEFLHDYRIQLRKIRSVLSLFKGVYDAQQTASLKTQFAALMMPTGQLRNLDVYLLEKQAYYDLVPHKLHKGLDALYGMFAERRQAEQLKLARHLRSSGHKQAMAGLAASFAQPGALKQGPNADLPAQAYARKLIWKRYRKVCKTAAAIGSDTDDAEVHALRIHCKKLRYLMEFFGPVFPQAAFKKLLKSLKGLQNNLGRFNDYSVHQASLQAILLELPQAQSPHSLEIAQSLGALIGVLHNGQLQERAKIMKNFARFNSPAIQQTFSALFQAPKA